MNNKVFEIINELFPRKFDKEMAYCLLDNEGWDIVYVYTDGSVAIERKRPNADYEYRLLTKKPDVPDIQLEGGKSTTATMTNETLLRFVFEFYVKCQKEGLSSMFYEHTLDCAWEVLRKRIATSLKCISAFDLRPGMLFWLYGWRGQDGRILCEVVKDDNSIYCTIDPVTRKLSVVTVDRKPNLVLFRYNEDYSDGVMQVLDDRYTFELCEEQD